MCVCVCRKADGQNPGAITLTMEPGALLGAYTTHSFGESPSEENASRLSQILEECPHPKYSLSEKACTGILNRAARRGKELPPELKAALEAQSAFRNAPVNQGGAKDSSCRMSEQADCQPKNSKTYSIQGNTIDRDVKQNGGGISTDTAHTLNGTDRHGVFAVDCRNGTENPTINGTLQAKSTGGQGVNFQNVVRTPYNHLASISDKAKMPVGSGTEGNKPLPFAAAEEETISHVR